MRYFRTEPVFLCSFHFISFLVPGLRACSAGRDTEKTTNPSGLCPASYGEPRRQLNSHNGKEYPPSWGSTRRRQRRACQGGVATSYPLLCKAPITSGDSASVSYRRASAVSTPFISMFSIGSFHIFRSNLITPVPFMQAGFLRSTNS